MPPADLQRPPSIIAGAMSGTSADGVDVALTRITGRGTAMTAELLHHHHVDYSAETRNEIFAFRGGDASVNLSRLARLGRTISLAYATAVNESLTASRISAADLGAIAAHGQTLYHGPPDTIQWFDPALVAAEVGCPVISDFRRADLAAGGQGAPLVPFADYILFRHPTKNRVLLNIGGISNITYLRAGGDIDDVVAFDTGPGNCISDYLMRKHDPSGPGYDAGGRRAFPADWIEPLVRQFLTHPYFSKSAPKSTDGPEMIGAWESAVRETGHENASLNELLATACYVTSATICDAILQRFPEDAIEVVASGGGTRNEAIMSFLEAGSDEVSTTDALGVPADAKEAIAFALLGAATLDGEPSNVPSVTGARRAVVLGSITPAPGGKPE